MDRSQLLLDGSEGGIDRRLIGDVAFDPQQVVVDLIGLGARSDRRLMAVGGELTGLEGMDQGAGLDITPYIKGSAHMLPADGDDDLLGDIGVDVSWRPTPSTTLRVTTNTDFAETEVDEIQVNLTRFSLFFPEKREFFLENSGIFEFGTPGGRRGPLFRLFFSRRIGISTWSRGRVSSN